MSKINLRGVIVPSEYDQEWLASYIEKGMFVPESYFRSELEQAKVDEPLTVHVNSPGGSVFSAYEMVNAVLAWKQETNQTVTVDIGAMAASAASAFAVMCGDVVNCYPNSKMMFHSATTVTLAGPQGHADTADLLTKINQDIQDVLISRYGMDEEVVAEWFDEGREGWLSAEDMKEAGVVSEIMASFVSAVEFTAQDIENVKDRGLDVAALFESGANNMTKSDEQEIEVTPELEPVDEVLAEIVEPVSETVVAPAADEPSDGPEEAQDEEIEEVENVGETIEEEPSDVSEVAEPVEEVPANSSATAIAYDEGFLAGQRNGQADANEGIVAKFTGLEDAVASLEEQVDSLTTSLAGSEKERSVLQARLERMTAGFGAPSQEEFDGPMNWFDAMEACGQDYAEARRKYPNLYRELRKDQETNRT